MPQMAPLMWFSLFLFFLLIYLLFNIMNYYSFLPENKSSQDKTSVLNKINLTWKW